MKIKDKILKLEEELESARNDLKNVRSRRKILCYCGEFHKIQDLIVIITHFYIEPYGCTGGDYWKEGEWQFSCPSTNKINRIMFNDYSIPYKERFDINTAAEPTFKFIYKNLFKSIKKLHDIENKGDYNNYFVDQNRKLFELPEVIT